MLFEMFLFNKSLFHSAINMGKHSNGNGNTLNKNFFSIIYNKQALNKCFYYNPSCGYI